MGCFLNYLDNCMSTVGAEQRFRPQQHAGGNVGAEQRFRPQQRTGSNVGGDVSHVATAHKQRMRGRCHVRKRDLLHWHIGGNVGAEQRFRPQQRISSASVADVTLGSVTSYIGTSQSGSLPFWPRSDSFSAERVIFP